MKYTGWDVSDPEEGLEGEEIVDKPEKRQRRTEAKIWKSRKLSKRTLAHARVTQFHKFLLFEINNEARLPPEMDMARSPQRDNLPTSRHPRMPADTLE